MEYVGEHLWPGQLGNFAVVLAFAAAALSAVAYFFEERQPDLGWKRIGRVGFWVHSLSIFGIIGMLMYMLYNHMFEYHYVWQHSNLAMPMRYIISAFWEGQEGSTILWLMGHVVIGNLLMRTLKNWEAPVMSVFSSAQVLITSMLLGVYIFESKYGSNPFALLLREHPDFLNAPVFADPHYLKMIDGRGLNPLLQNYWMTIHPPTVFIGFALTLVPFSFAIAGLWRGDLKTWMKPALPWVFAGVCILGLAILMGGAWAYEALSFGGFWAWDPVENASLVPWLTLVGSAHLMLINRNKQSSVFLTHLLTIVSFILVVYSTFLTKSGILGDASVHSFTDLGLSGQLLLIILFFTAISSLVIIQNKTWRLTALATFLVLYAGYWLGIGTAKFSLLYALAVCGFAYWSYTNEYPKAEKEDAFFSREFFMFTGALVLLISAFQISVYTSLPVFNKLTPVFAPIWNLLGSWINSPVFEGLAQGDLAPKTDKVVYNNWQVPLAIITTFLMALAQVMRYRKNEFKTYWQKLAPATYATLAIGLGISFGLGFTSVFYVMLVFTGVYAVATNFYVLVKMAKGNLQVTGSSLAHIGFALIMLGSLISAGKSKTISQNTSNVDITQLGETYDNTKNILLFRGDTTKLDKYQVIFSEKEKDGINMRYNVHFFEEKDGQLDSVFSLAPFVQMNEIMGNVAEPSTKHYLHKDIFTHVTWADLESHESGYREPATTEVGIGDTVEARSCIAILENITRDVDSAKYMLQPNDIAIAAEIRVFNFDAVEQYAKPVFILRDSTYAFSIVDSLSEGGQVFSFDKINPSEGTFDITIIEPQPKEFIVLEAIIFPYITVLWLGCLLMVIGTGIAVFQRFRTV